MAGLAFLNVVSFPFTGLNIMPQKAYFYIFDFIFSETTKLVALQIVSDYCLTFFKMKQCKNLRIFLCNHSKSFPLQTTKQKFFGIAYKGNCVCVCMCDLCLFNMFSKECTEHNSKILHINIFMFVFIVAPLAIQDS